MAQSFLNCFGNLIDCLDDVWSIRYIYYHFMLHDDAAAAVGFVRWWEHRMKMDSKTNL